MKHIYLSKLSFLPTMFLDYIRHHYIYSMVDFGCGYGFWYYILSKNNLLAETAFGIDNDKGRIEYMVDHIKGVNGVVGDITKVKFPQARFNLAVCNHAIEHTLDDNAVIQNIYDSLITNGILYISSIIRKEPAWYMYRYQGEIRLSPKHIKEYRNLDEFSALLKSYKFKVMQIKESQYWMKCWRIPGLRGKLALPIPGFKRCEALCIKT